MVGNLFLFGHVYFGVMAERLNQDCSTLAIHSTHPVRAVPNFSTLRIAPMVRKADSERLPSLPNVPYTLDQIRLSAVTEDIDTERRREGAHPFTRIIRSVTP